MVSTSLILSFLFKRIFYSTKLFKDSEEHGKSSEFHENEFSGAISVSVGTCVECFLTPGNAVCVTVFI